MAGAAVAVMIRKSREEIVHHFTHAGATAPEHAVPFDPDAIGSRHALVRRRQFRRMRDFGAVREPRPGRFYLDETRLDEFRASMMRRTAGLIAVALGAVAAIAALT